MGIVPATYGIRSGGLSRADIIRIIEAEIAKSGTGTGLDAAGAQAIIAAMLKEGASVDLSLNTEKTELTISVDSDTLTIPVKIFAVQTAYTAGELVRGGTDNADVYLIRTNIAASNTQTLDQLTTAVRQIGGGGDSSQLNIHGLAAGTGDLDLADRVAVSDESETDDPTVYRTLQALVAFIIPFSHTVHKTPGIASLEDFVSYQDGSDENKELKSSVGDLLRLRAGWRGAWADGESWLLGDEFFTGALADGDFKIFKFLKDVGAADALTLAALDTAAYAQIYPIDVGERNIFRGGWVAGAYKAWEVVIRNRYLFRYTEDIPSNNTTPPESDSRAQRLIAAGPDDPVKITGNANVLTITKRDGTTSTITIEIAGMAEEVGRDLFIADYAVSDMATQDADTDTEFDFTGETLVQGSAPQVTLDTTADTITINKKGAYAIAVEMKVTDEGTSGNSRLNAIIEYKMNGGTWHTLTSSVYVRPLTPNESVLHASTDVLFAQNDVVKFRYHGDIGTSSGTPRISISEISLRLFERPLKVNSTDDAIADKTAATPEEDDLLTFADKSDSNKEKSTEIKNVLALLGVGIKDWTPLVTTGTQFLANASNTAVASATLAFSNSVYVPVPDGFLFYLEFEIGGATVEEAAFSIILPTLPQAVTQNPPFNLDSVHAVAYQKSGSGSVIEVEEDGDVRDFNIGLSLSEALTGSNKANFSVLGILKVTRNS